MENISQVIVGNKFGSCLCTFYNNGRAAVMIIDDVKVVENYRHRGIATSIINEAIELAESKNVDSIELVSSSTGKLYRTTGFKKTNKKHYRRILNIK